MENPTQHRPGKRQALWKRLDAAAEDLNAALLVLAIGLAVLDLTCFFALEVRNAMPPRLPAEAAVATPATAAIPPVQAAAPMTAPGNGGSSASSLRDPRTRRKDGRG
jgi:hypothetical protein